MKINRPNVDHISGFEVYLEGIKVPFVSLSISESEGSIPAAGVVFPGASGALRILPGTILQIFGDVYNRRFGKKVPSLLFEGEIVSVNYSKSASSETISVEAGSLLARAIQAKLKPTDALVTVRSSRAEMIFDQKATIQNERHDSPPPSDDKSMNSATVLHNVTAKVLETNKDSYIEGETANLGVISALGGLSEEIAVALQKGPAAKGDLWPLVRDFNKFFEISDIYYGINSLSYQIGPSLFALPNPGMIKAFQISAGLEAFSRINQDLKDMFGQKKTSFTLWECLQTVTQYMKYKFIAPAAPTGVQMFYQKTTAADYKPLRGVYLPDIDGGPPAMCNVFFPEHVTSLSYQRRMTDEPTRLIGKMHLPFVNSGVLQVGAPIYVVPDVPIGKEETTDGSTQLRAAYTDEETYRGIQAKHQTFDGAFVHAAFDNYMAKFGDGKATVNEIGVKELKTSLADQMRIFCVHAFLSSKFGSRTVSITTHWNPYRFIGLPGMVFGPNRPTIIGIVSSISSQISPNGSATSNVTMRNCRVVYDDEAAFSLTLNDDDEFVAKNLFSAETDLSYYLVNPLVGEGMVAANEWIYNKALYGFETIGEDVYTYLIEGISAPRRAFEVLGDDNKTYNGLTDKIWKDYKGNLVPTKFLSSNVSDNSILNFIKERSTNQIRIKPEFRLSSLANFPLEIQYTALLYKAISEFKLFYQTFRSRTTGSRSDMSAGNDGLYQFIDNTNWRNLVTKQEYLNYIGSSGNESDHFNESKDLMYILNTAKYRLIDVRKDIEVIGKKQRAGVRIGTSGTIAGMVEELKNVRNEYTKIEKGLQALANTFGGDNVTWSHAPSANIYKIDADTLKLLKEYDEGTWSILSAIDPATGVIKVDNFIGQNSTFSSLINNQEAAAQKEAAIEERQRLREKLKMDLELVKDALKMINDNIKDLETKDKTYSDLQKKVLLMRNPNLALFRPYNINRRAHVVYAFKNIKLQKASSDKSRNTSIITET